MIWKLSDRLSHIFLLPKSNLLDQQLCIECILIFICNIIWKKKLYWEMWIILLNMCWIPSYIYKKKNAFTSYRSLFFCFLIHGPSMFLKIARWNYYYFYYYYYFAYVHIFAYYFSKIRQQNCLAFFQIKLGIPPPPQANYLACVLCNNTFPAISIEFQLYM